MTTTEMVLSHRVVAMVAGDADTLDEREIMLLHRGSMDQELTAKGRYALTYEGAAQLAKALEDIDPENIAGAERILARAATTALLWIALADDNCVDMQRAVDAYELIHGGNR